MTDSETRSGPLWKKLSLLCVTLSLCAGLCEVVVRSMYPEYGIAVHQHRLFTEPDPLLGWRLVPNFRGQHVQEEFTVFEQINSRSMRGPEFPYAKPDSTYRILVLGDSFAEGYTVEFEALFSEIMSKRLNARLDREVEVINAGTGGYSTDQELLFWRTEGWQYQPDLTVLLFFVNDLTFNILADYGPKKRGQKPLFELVDGELSLKSTPKATWDRAEELAADRAEHPMDNAFVPWKAEGWFLYRLVRHRLTGKPPKALGELPTVPTEPVVEALTEPSQPDDAQELRGVSSNRARKEWRMTEALLAQLKAETAAGGSEFLLYYVPMRGEVYGRDRSVSSNESTLEHNLQIVAQRNGIEFIPTVELFQAQAESLAGSGEFLYWKQDPHWTAAGNHLTGLILADHIQRNRTRYGLGAE